MKKGLSEQEIEARSKKLKEKYWSKYPDLDMCQIWQKYTAADKKLDHELDFRSWVNSCLIYSCDYKLEANHLQQFDHCFGGSTLSLYQVSLERALEIIEEQKERFKEAKVEHDVYTDSDDCSYNSCTWTGDKK